MSKRKKRKKQKQKRTTPDQCVINSLCSIDVSDDSNLKEIKTAIKEAILAAENDKAKQNEEYQKQGFKEWQINIGLPDCSILKWYLKIPIFLFSRIWFLIRLPFVKKRRIKNEQITFGLLKMLLSVFLQFVSVFLLFITISCLPFDFIEKLLIFITRTDQITTIHHNITKILLFIIGYLAAGLFHVASIEMELIKDRNVFFGYFASFGVLATIVISIIC